MRQDHVSPPPVAAWRLLWAKYRRPILGTLTIAMVLVAWQVCSDTGVVDAAFTSSPTSVFSSFIEYVKTPGAHTDLRLTATEAALGLLLSIVVGVPLGFVIGRIRLVEELLEPVLNLFYSMPRIALAPLFIIWFGIGLESKVVVVFLSAVFPVIIQVASGVKVTPEDLLKMAHAYNAKRLFIARTIVLPASLPVIVSALRLAVANSLVGAVVAELVASTGGIGYMINTAGATFQTERVLVGVFLLAFTGLLLNSLLRQLERRLDRWRSGSGPSAATSGRKTRSAR